MPLLQKEWISNSVYLYCKEWWQLTTILEDFPHFYAFWSLMISSEGLRPSLVFRHIHTSIHPILDLEGVRDCRQLFSNYFLLWACQKKILVSNLLFGWLQKSGDKKGVHGKSYFQTERAKNFVQVLAQKFKALGKRVTNQMRRQILTPFMAFDDHFRWAFAKLMMIEQKFHTSTPHT